jgi:hypothetical protein
MSKWSGGERSSVSLDPFGRSADLARLAVMGFHPAMADHGIDYDLNIGVKVLLCIGAADPIIPVEHRAIFERR